MCGVPKLGCYRTAVPPGNSMAAPVLPHRSVSAPVLGLCTLLVHSCPCRQHLPMFPISSLLSCCCQESITWFVASCLQD